MQHDADMEDPVVKSESQMDPLELDEMERDDSGRFLCSDCSYKSNRKSNVSQHRLYKHTSLSQRNWICHSCEKHFAEQKGLTRHAAACRGKGEKMLGRPLGESKRACKRNIEVDSVSTEETKSQKKEGPVCQPCYVMLGKPVALPKESYAHKVRELKKFSFTHDLAAMALVETAVGPIGKCSNVLHPYRYLANSCVTTIKVNHYTFVGMTKKWQLGRYWTIGEKAS